MRGRVWPLAMDHRQVERRRLRAGQLAEEHFRVREGKLLPLMRKLLLSSHASAVAGSTLRRPSITFPKARSPMKAQGPTSLAPDLRQRSGAISKVCAPLVCRVQLFFHLFRQSASVLPRGNLANPATGKDSLNDTNAHRQVSRRRQDLVTECRKWNRLRAT